MKLLSTLLIGLLVLLNNPVQAEQHDKDNGFKARQADQQERLGTGVNNADLIRAEANRLRMRKRHIDRYEQRSRQDSHGMTQREKQHLDSMRDNQNKAKNHERHDVQTR